MMQDKPSTASVSDHATHVEQQIAAPDLSYRPCWPQPSRRGIGLIGCGAITVDHLRAYRDAGFRLVALTDLEVERAHQRAKEFFPEAEVCATAEELLALPSVDVVDIATHPPERVSLIEAAISQGKHILSQKPFVEDLETGERLCQLAQDAGVLLAVNQNGRWAPHFSYLRNAASAGLLGEISAIHCGVHWDHSWVADTPFEDVRHLILYDFAIHWFDLVACLMEGRQAERVYASFTHSHHQTVRPALLGQAVVEYRDAQASLVFDGDVNYGALDTTFVSGDRGTFYSSGPDLKEQQVQLTQAEGVARPVLEGVWFPDAFAGTMGELLLAIEENREPSHSARNNLESLKLCFAAVASAERHVAVVPGDVTSIHAG